MFLSLFPIGLNIFLEKFKKCHPLDGDNLIIGENVVRVQIRSVIQARFFVKNLIKLMSFGLPGWNGFLTRRRGKRRAPTATNRIINKLLLSTRSPAIKQSAR